MSTLEVKWKGKEIVVTDWDRDGKMVNAYEAEFKATGKSLTEDQLLSLAEDCAYDLYQEAYIDDQSALHDRAKDFRKYGE